MKKICEFLFYEIMYFLPNECLMKMKGINKSTKRMMIDKIFKDNVIKRKHPIVFNVFDNFCLRCNFKELLEYIRCGHINPLIYDSCKHVN